MLFVSAAIVLLAIGYSSITSEAAGDQTLLKAYQDEIGKAGDICVRPTANYSEIRDLFAAILRWHKPGNEAYRVLKISRDHFDEVYGGSMDPHATLKKFLILVCSVHKKNLEIYLHAQDENKEKKGRVRGGFMGGFSGGHTLQSD